VKAICLSPHINNRWEGLVVGRQRWSRNFRLGFQWGIGGESRGTGRKRLWAMGRHATAQRERRGESGGAEGMGGGGVWGVVLGTPHRHEGGKEEGRGGSPWDPTAALDGGCGRSSDNAESLRSSAPAAGSRAPGFHSGQQGFGGTWRPPLTKKPSQWGRGEDQHHPSSGATGRGLPGAQNVGAGG